jgi:hypothetical protein
LAKAGEVERWEDQENSFPDMERLLEEFRQRLYAREGEAFPEGKIGRAASGGK